LKLIKRQSPANPRQPWLPADFVLFGNQQMTSPTNPAASIAQTVSNLMEGRDLPPFNSPERHRIVADIRAMVDDTTLLQFLGASTLSTLLDRLKASAQADREAALLIDASRLK
jgi:hypothetical protein